jgi:aspartate aminotransferase
MNILSDRILSLEESQTIAMARQSRELIDSGVDVISLSLGEPDFDTPDFIKEAEKKRSTTISLTTLLFLV